MSYDKLMTRLMTAIIIFMVMGMQSAQLAVYAVYGDGNIEFHPYKGNERIALNDLMKEHTVITSMSLRALLKGEEKPYLNDLIDENGSEISSIIHKAYGDDASSRFAPHWTQQIMDYRNYALGVKNNDEAQKNLARENLREIAVTYGMLFAQAGRSGDRATIENLMRNHTEGITAVIDAASRQDEKTSSQLTKTAYDQAGVLADEISQGIPQ